MNSSLKISIVVLCLGLTGNCVWGESGAGQKLSGKGDNRNVSAFDVSFASSLTEDGRTGVFDCAGFVFAKFALPPFSTGEHLIEGKWVRPDGFIQERSQLSVNADSAENQTAYLYLRFEDHGMDTLDFGLNNFHSHPFNGNWRLEIQKDGKPVVAKSFQVKCY